MIRLLTLTLLFCVGLGCRAREQSDPLQPAVVEPVQRAMHRSVADPPPVEGHEPVLWVALEDHLGAAQTAAPLHLQAFAGSLSLRDATGEQSSGSAFVISWRSVALARPLKLARRIAGPYASFESADRVASRWLALGVAAEVAHPKEWEVWAPEGSPVPDGLAVRDWQSTVTSTVEPVLQTLEGERPLQGPLLIEASDGSYTASRHAGETWSPESSCRQVDLPYPQLPSGILLSRPGMDFEPLFHPPDQSPVRRKSELLHEGPSRGRNRAICSILSTWLLAKANITTIWSEPA